MRDLRVSTGPESHKLSYRGTTTWNSSGGPLGASTSYFLRPTRQRSLGRVRGIVFGLSVERLEVGQPPPRIHDADGAAGGLPGAHRALDGLEVARGVGASGAMATPVVLQSTQADPTTARMVPMATAVVL